MSIFEGVFGGSKHREAVEEAEMIVPGEAVIQEEIKKKSIEDIKQTKEQIAGLQGQRESLVEKHRDSKAELESMGVREIPVGGIARSETYNDILNPIEEEITKIGTEITELREDYDLQPNRIEVLNNRLKRLEELADREKNEFQKTVAGGNFYAMNARKLELNKQINEFISNHAQPAEYKKESEEFSDLDKKIHYEVINDKLISSHFDRLDRINHLMARTGSTRHDAKSTGYDENGISSR